MPNFNTYILSLSEIPQDALNESNNEAYLFDMPDVRMVSGDFLPMSHDGCVFVYHNVDYRCQEAELNIIENLLEVLPVRSYYSYQLFIRRTKFGNRFKEYNYQQALNYIRYDMDRLGDKIPTDFAGLGLRLVDDEEDSSMVTWESGYDDNDLSSMVLKHEPRANKMLLGYMENLESFVPYHPANMVDVPKFHDEWELLLEKLTKRDSETHDASLT